MTVFEYGKDIVILDMGVQFPEEDMPGIDYIIPNVSYLQGKEKNIRAVIFSHGHLDHIGAAPILLKKLNYPPIVGRDLTVALIKKRLEDYAKGSAKRLEYTVIGDVVNTTARVQSLARQYNGYTLFITAATLAALEPEHGLKLENLGELPLRGKAEPVQVYAVRS